ncbi:MAG: hypothetical protein IKJ37_11530 [Kiritimatiellae bacterium]|nr:hypothetical protein [Kiritimatiellia bacterium]
MRAPGFFRFAVLPLSLFFATVIVGVLSLPVDRQACDANELMESVEPVPVLTAEKIRSIIPSEWEIVASRNQSGGWQQMGRVRAAFDETAAAISAFMGAHGYALVQCVTNGVEVGGGLYAYGNPDGSGRVMWSLYPAGRGCTSFAWGVER